MDNSDLTLDAFKLINYIANNITTSTLTADVTKSIMKSFDNLLEQKS